MQRERSRIKRSYIHHNTQLSSDNRERVAFSGRLNETEGERWGGGERKEAVIIMKKGEQE